MLQAGSGGAALDMLHQRVKVDLMLIDFAMPGMNGAEVARFVRAKHPRLPILFATGFADRAALVGVKDSHIIGKPITDAELEVKIQFALSGQASGAANTAG